jgi:hypothetical protein
VIVNGHGGNRGVLENLLYELHGDFGLNACAIHPFDLARIESTSEAPDIHGGKSETSVMLALAPDRVRMKLLAGADSPHKPEAVEALIFTRGATWPWRSDNPGLGGSIPSILVYLFDDYCTTKNANIGRRLPICRSIMEAHGGRIRVHNGLALGGACFCFELPARIG